LDSFAFHHWLPIAPSVATQNTSSWSGSRDTAFFIARGNAIDSNYISIFSMAERCNPDAFHCE
jgi:hypothetical protein